MITTILKITATTTGILAMSLWFLVAAKDRQAETPTAPANGVNIWSAETNTVWIYGAVTNISVTNEPGFWPVFTNTVSADGFILTMQDTGQLTNVVKKLLNDGTVCRIRGGHIWTQTIRVIMPMIDEAADPSPPQRCAICGAERTYWVYPTSR